MWCRDSSKMQKPRRASSRTGDVRHWVQQMLREMRPPPGERRIGAACRIQKPSGQSVIAV
jgi:hypothetical protein